MALRSLPFLLSAGVALAANAANTPRFTFAFPSSATIASAATAIAVDSTGHTYLAGIVNGNAFTATPGAYQPQYPGGRLCIYGPVTGGVPIPGPCVSTFVVKLDPFGALVFATYLGGGANTTPLAIAIDPQGNVYVTGATQGGFPITPGAAFASPSFNSFSENASFIAKLNATGTQLEYATYIPANVSAIAVDTAGSVYFTGSDIQGDLFPTTPGAFQSSPANPAQNGIVGKLNASGSALVYGTYLSGAQGGSGGIGIAVDSAGNALVGGSTAASDFPATEGQYVNSVTGDNIFLAKFNSGATALIFSSLLGPGGASAMSVAPGGDVYFGCLEIATDLPSAAAPFGGNAPAGGGTYYYLFHVSADGSTLLSTIYLPFSLSALAVDSGGNADLLGSGIVATTAGAFQSSAPNGGQVLVAKIAPDGQVAGATYAGPLSGGNVIAAESDGSVVVGGNTTSSFSTINFFPAITIENAASYVANTAVPGEIVVIQGYGIGPAVGVTSAPTVGLGGVQVYFDNFAAPVMYAQANQLNVQVPWEIAGQSTTQLQIQYGGAQAGSVSLPVSPALPGVFFIVNSDGAFNSPANPARPGDFVAIYGTGGGAMSPAGITGGTWPLTPLSNLAQAVSATVGAEKAQVLYGGSAPTLDTGLFQINVLLPSDLPAGAQTLSVAVGRVASVPVAISIQ